MKALLTRLRKRIAELRAQTARRSLSPHAMRSAWARFQDTGEPPADELQAAHCRLLAAFGDFADTSCWPADDADGPERHRLAGEAYADALNEYNRVRREHGLR